MSTPPRWLEWSRELAGIAQTGLTYARDPFDRERYVALRSLAAEILADHTGVPPGRLETLLAGETGYATPKIDVRAAVIDATNRILMVREKADHGRWTLPGGWADVNHTPAESVAKEVREESGYEVRVRKLAAMWDRTRQGHPEGVFSCWKFFFLCDLLGGTAQTSLETSEVAWFGEHALPTDLSLQRVLPHQVERMFQHAASPGLPTDFD